MKPLLSPARLAELLRRYPTEANAELGKAFGISERQVCNLASNNNVVKAVGRTKTNGKSTRQQALAVVAAAGAAGLSRAEASAALPGIEPDQISTALNNLSTAHQLFRAGQRYRSRWFATLEHALAFDANNLGKQAREIVAAAAPREAAIDPAMPREICQPVPGPAARLVPTTSDGLFKNLRPGRYIDAKPRDWVAAVTTPSAKR